MLLTFFGKWFFAWRFILNDKPKKKKKQKKKKIKQMTKSCILVQDAHIKLQLMNTAIKRRGYLNRRTTAQDEQADLIFRCLIYHTLRKHAYSNILKILPPKNENFQIKNSHNFLISAQNIDYEYPQSMSLSRMKKIMYTPINPSFTI